MGSASIVARATMPPDGNPIQAASVAEIVGECRRMGFWTLRADFAIVTNLELRFQRPIPMAERLAQGPVLFSQEAARAGRTLAAVP
jgi:hypothetical protein